MFACGERAHSRASDELSPRAWRTLLQPVGVYDPYSSVAYSTPTLQPRITYVLTRTCIAVATCSRVAASCMTDSDFALHAKRTSRNVCDKCCRHMGIAAMLFWPLLKYFWPGETKRIAWRTLWRVWREIQRMAVFSADAPAFVIQSKAAKLGLRRATVDIELFLVRNQYMQRTHNSTHRFSRQQFVGRTRFLLTSPLTRPSFRQPPACRPEAIYS